MPESPVTDCARKPADAEAGPEQVYRMLCANPAAGQAFCRFMVSGISACGGAEPGGVLSTLSSQHVWRSLTSVHVHEWSYTCAPFRLRYIHI